MNIIKRFLKSIGRKSDNKSVNVTVESKEQKERIMDEKEQVKVEEKATETTDGKDTVKDTAKETVKTEETKTDGAQPEGKTEEQTAPTEEPETPTVTESEPTGNGIRIEDVVLKTDLHEAIAALEAKYDALFKENTDLKEKLANADKDRDELRKKYEDDDFGGYSKQGVDGKNKSANDTFESYSKQFM